MKISKIINFNEYLDDRGSLVAIEDSCGLPFDINRIYYIFGLEKGASRGYHAHRKLHQIAVCIAGSCKMVLDNGVDREEVYMKSPKFGIDLPPMLWHEMYDFSDDCIMLVLASDQYDEDDYIRDYLAFKDIYQT